MKYEETGTQWVSFTLGRELFACKINKVQEVIPYQAPIPVPGAPDEIEGILNVRGEIIPIISGTQIALGTHTSESHDAAQEDHDKDGSIIIIESDLGQIGMTIDSVNEIIQVSPQSIQYDEVKNSCISGSVLHNNSLIILLDIEPKNFQSQAYA
tara:strand:+ start:33065 stop:33526 length:462 start_codon:yes stop_codon:yes gene_type:complete